MKTKFGQKNPRLDPINVFCSNLEQNTSMGSKVHAGVLQGHLGSNYLSTNFEIFSMKKLSEMFMLVKYITRKVLY